MLIEYFVANVSLFEIDRGDPDLQENIELPLPRVNTQCGWRSIYAFPTMEKSNASGRAQLRSSEPAGGTRRPYPLIQAVKMAHGCYRLILAAARMTRSHRFQAMTFVGCPLCLNTAHNQGFFKHGLVRLDLEAKLTP